MSSVLIVAAEASSCLYAERLLEHWASESKEVKAFGIGSRKMVEDHGFEAYGLAEELAVVGLQEVIKHFPKIRRTFHDIIDEIEKRQPKFALLLDYPGFNLRLAKKLKSMGVTVVYYISPQVWAWKKNRIKTIQKVVDKMLVLFPFEKDFYEKHNVPVEFVGHPIIDEIKEEYYDPDYRNESRQKFGIRSDEKLLALMPGSRDSELHHHLEHQLEVARIIYERHNIRLALFVAPTFTVDQMRARLSKIKFPVQLIKAEPFKMIMLADMVLTASGTATLLVGILARPMVIMYRMNSVTAMFAKHFVKATKYFGMSNIILEKETSKECFQAEASVEKLVRHIEDLLDEKNYNQQKEELLQLKEKLGDGGATKKVAHAVEEYF